MSAEAVLPAPALSAASDGRSPCGGSEPPVRRRRGRASTAPGASNRGQAGSVQRSPDHRRERLRVRGAVQGVGFRPWVWRLARAHGLTGWVRNAAGGVWAEVEGSPPALAAFRAALARPRPPARVDSITAQPLALRGERAFRIAASRGGGSGAALLPDLAPCGACLAELFDPAARRYRYAFTSCARCGPRHSIALGPVWDRAATTMTGFAPCRECAREYASPHDRRFHAQTLACPACGPKLALWDGAGRVLADGDAALRGAVAALREGAVVAFKGVGGFQLLADARDEHAVTRLRAGKRRPEKPFALLFADLAAVRRHCVLPRAAAAALTSPAAPIVLLARQPDTPPLAPGVAPGCPDLGAMLPASPAHHLIASDFAAPLVCTSGNRADAPLCTDENAALAALRGVADLFLIHDRPIARPLDDSVVQLAAGRVQVLRRARGYAAAPVARAARDGACPGLRSGVLALGGHLKAAVSLSAGGAIVAGAHVGDLDTAAARSNLAQSAAELPRLLRTPVRRIVCDLHPDHIGAALAGLPGVPVTHVQHHLAHLAACRAEHGLSGPLFGVAFDGAGYGPDGTLWGGEFLHLDGTYWRRAAHLRTFSLPGAETGLRDPRYSALGVLHALAGEAAFARAPDVFAQFTAPQRAVLVRALASGVGCTVTSSAGRLFDAVTALTGVRLRPGYEGRAAAELEWAARASRRPRRYACSLRVPARADTPYVLDWGPLIEAVCEDRAGGVPVADIAAGFHRALARGIVAAARAAGAVRVLLSGGCFQNRLLTAYTIDALRRAGFEPYWHRAVPPGDGGLSVGQAAVAALED